MFSFRVKPDSGEAYNLTVTSRDVVMWEKTDRSNRISRLENDPTITDLYSVTHIAARRQGMFHGSLAEWETSVDLDPITEENAQDPTQPGRLPGSL